MTELYQRVLAAIFVPIAFIFIAIISFFVILLGRPEARLEIERGASRALSGTWDGQGDSTYSAWSYRMVVHGKRWGPARVKFVDWINREPGHCQRAYEWHRQHGLCD